MPRTIPAPIPAPILLAVLGALGTGAAAPVAAAEPVELNVRHGIDNASRNRIASARLRAMLADERAGGGIPGIGSRDAGDCSTHVGNDESDSPLDQGAPVIVVGDIINVCQ